MTDESSSDLFGLDVKMDDDNRKLRMNDENPLGDIVTQLHIYIVTQLHSYIVTQLHRKINYQT